MQPLFGLCSGVASCQASDPSPAITPSRPKKMPRAKVAAPAAAQIKANPREFALYTQCKPASDGTVDGEVLEAFQKLYGTGKESKDGMSFDEFAALFSKPSMEASFPGSGNCLGYAAMDATSGLKPFKFERRAPGPQDVRIQITHAGICHSDVHQVRNEWSNSTFPMVPGHEIVGIVTEVGPQATKFKVGDRAGIGCMVMSCLTCEACTKHNKQYCKKCVFTYNGTDTDGKATQGGYSNWIVCDERFVLKVPENLDLAEAAPLLCAGITVYSPLRFYGLDKPGMSVGVVGLGGLGHMAVKVAKAMGCKVTVISTSESKREEATKVLGADNFVVSKDKAQMEAATETLDGIINTVSAPHPFEPLLDLLKLDGKMVVVGVPPQPPAFPSFQCIFKRLTIGGSLIGGIKETQEMLDFCGQHGIGCMIEKIPIDYVNTAYDRMLKADVRYRFVIDIQGSLVQ